MPVKINKCCCPNCGSVIELQNVHVNLDSQWLPCVLPTGFEWNLPSGKLTPAVGPVIYVDATGNHLSREEYLSKFNIDPEIAYQNMRGKNKKDPVTVGSVVSKAVESEISKRTPLKLGRY